jgi:hypothetical protein
MTVWKHSRKGRIEGTVVKADDDWVWIQLAAEHTLNYYSESNRGHVDHKDEVIVVRRSFLTEITEATP